MKILPLRPDLTKKPKKARLTKRYQKQKILFENDHRHPSLHTEKLRPTHLNIYSFRLNRQWRVVFILHNPQTVEVIDINPHYNQ
jgi:Txe/YoeB family toxin of Txe-Axe toxin-antitoxin module